MKVQQGTRVTQNGDKRILRLYPRIRRYGRQLGQYKPGITSRCCLFCGLQDCYEPGGCLYQVYEEQGVEDE